jgi:murein DD-endopeptidase MepM/ murein hydrolase activator NlpD
MSKSQRPRLRPGESVAAAASLCLIIIAIGQAPADEKLEPAGSFRTPLVRVVDLNVGESQKVVLAGGKEVTVTLDQLTETRDSVRSAVRHARVEVVINGKPGILASAMYHLPVTIGNVQIDCPITKGLYSNTNADAWGLAKDARLRLWPADSPLVEPETFLYPVKQRWFASGTQMGNEPSYIDDFERDKAGKIYYHSGEDIGGAEGLVEVVAATDALVVSRGLEVLAGHGKTDDPDTPVAERYDVVYLRDNRGWYYRYSHLYEIDQRIVPGRTIQMGERLGLIGKEGASGGWSHLHFEIKSRQPSGKWGTQASYAFLWEAYRRQYQPKMQAVARPHHLIFAGESAELDGGKSWSASGKIARYDWAFTDGSAAAGAAIERTYRRPGEYSEVLRVTDADGRIDYDFAIVQVINRERPDDRPPTIHAVYFPTFGIKAGDPVTFKVRTFGTTHGREVWDFGDGSGESTTQSDGNVERHAKDGYAVIQHRYEKPGHYLVRVERANERGEKAITHLQVRVGEE